jgi:hypothetical protein
MVAALRTCAPDHLWMTSRWSSQYRTHCQGALGLNRTEHQLACLAAIFTRSGTIIGRSRQNVQNEPLVALQVRNIRPMDRSVDKADRMSRWLGRLVATRGHRSLPALVVYVHVPKAGGMAVTRMLRDIYGGQLLVAQPRGWPQVLSDDTLRDIRANLHFYRAYSGHHAFGIHEVFGRPARYMTTIREPLSRLESYYNFVKHWEIHHHHRVARDGTIREFFQFLLDSNDVEVSNLQCLLMCGEKNFKKARKYLEANFEFVIPLPCLTQAPPVLAKAFDWPFVPNLHRENETIHKETMSELPDAMIDMLSEVNSADRQLYEYAVQRWSQVTRKQHQ